MYKTPLGHSGNSIPIGRGYFLGLIRKINPKKCIEYSSNPSSLKAKDLSRAKFIVLKSYVGKSGVSRLGYLWLILEPIIGSLVFLSVLTILRGAAEIQVVNVLLGYSILASFNVGFRSGLGNAFDDGGLKIERVSSRSILIAKNLKLLIDVFFISTGSAVACLLLGANPVGIVALYLSNMLIVISSNSILSLIQPLVSRFPDLNPIVMQLPLIIFFGSPILYPLGFTSGFHFTVSIFNPLVYFIEPVRHLATGNNDVLLLNQNYGLFLFLLFFFSIINFNRGFDDRRWKES